MNNENIQRILTDIENLVDLKPVTLSSDKVGKQFLFVGFSIMIEGHDFKPLSLDDILGYIKNNDMKMARVLHSVQYATVIESPTKGQSLASIEDYLAGKLQRPEMPYPPINESAPASAFTWTTTVTNPEQFALIFPQSKALNAPVYDLLYILYLFAQHNDLLGLYGPSVVNQIGIQLRQDIQFTYDLFDKLLALSNVLNKKKSVTH